MGYTVNGKHISSALNVKNYGVVGDGSTDDSDKLNAVLARSDCDSVYLPGGTYLISKTIQVPDGKSIRRRRYIKDKACIDFRPDFLSVENRKWSQNQIPSVICWRRLRSV